MNNEHALPVADGRAVRRHAQAIARRHPRLLGGAVVLHGAAALAAGEGQVLLAAKADADFRPSAHAQDFHRRDARGMSRGVTWQVGVPGPVDANAGMLVVTHGPDAVG